MRQSIAILTALAVLAAPLAAVAGPGDLPADPMQRAATCAAAISGQAGVLSGKPFTYETADRVGQFAIIGSAGQADKLPGLGQAMADAAKTLGPEGFGPAVAACDRAYPRTLANAPVRMPANEVDRGLGCMILAGTLGGIHKGAGTDSDPRAANYMKLAESLGAKLEAKLNAAGITTEEQLMARLQAVGPTVGDFGPPTKVAEACLKEFG